MKRVMGALERRELFRPTQKTNIQSMILTQETEDNQKLFSAHNYGGKLGLRNSIPWGQV